MASDNVIKIKVKTMWERKVWVHQKYLNECVRSSEPLEIHHDGKIMTVTKGQLLHNKPVKSEIPFYEKFGGGQYWLYGFDFKPDAEPPTLFNQEHND